VINHYSQSDLERILKEYGEIKSYKKMASFIVTRRLKKPFESAKELAEFIAENFSHPKLHPATLLFQAVRIEVNEELKELKNLLENLKNLNNSKLLVAIITFHSLEDKIVKATFKEWTKNCICPKGIFRCECGNNNSLGKIVTKKPIIATRKEIDKNPRSRSSKLRVFRFC
jgi:16S rRNA (cytosine1402-N4)-methyltransferase